MASNRRVSTTLVLMLVAAACNQAPVPQFTAADDAAIRALNVAASKAIEAGDWAAWAALYEPTALLQPPNARTIAGREALVSWGKTFPPVETSRWSNETVWGEGNLAFMTADYVLRIKDVPADSGKQLASLRRQPDGSWRVVAISFNSNLPAASPAPTTGKP